MGWIHPLDAVAEGIEVEESRHAHILHSAYSCLPVGAEPDTRLRVITLDGTEPVHAAEIVDAVHHSPPDGSFTPVYRSDDGLMWLRWETGSERPLPYESVSRPLAPSLRRAMAASPSPIRCLSAAASSGVHA